MLRPSITPGCDNRQYETSGNLVAPDVDSGQVDTAFEVDTGKPDSALIDSTTSDTAATDATPKADVRDSD